MVEACGIKNFFDCEDDLTSLKNIICSSDNFVKESDRTEYGDFQTNINLAIKISDYLNQNSCNPEIIIEPTCGKGNFIIACLNTFKQIEKILGVEIHKPYIWDTKFNILQYFIINPNLKKPEIEIKHFNVFDFDFRNISRDISNKEILIVGNPPWVTNSKLSVLNSSNIPIKSNIKNHNGIDAITGKGNFDIGEYITLKLIDTFHNSKGYFAFLLKNSVIKNIVYDQKQRNCRISDLKKLIIDSKKEFDVSVDASLFICKLNETPEFVCNEFDFYNADKSINQFGWIEYKFVSNIKAYKNCKDIDGCSPFEWRQGIKHDCSSIMELEKMNEYFVNGLYEKVNLEEGLVYGVLKSSDLKRAVIYQTRKYTIITQKKIGQDTSYIKNEYPKTFDYLYKNKTQFSLRKSSIYNNKPDYSIFGIGNYSFALYKIAISGMYKNYSFNLILPQKGKPIMLDDTCYFLGFDNLEYAVYTLILLNSETSQRFLQSITFAHAKRTFTKEILMRLDLFNLALQIPNKEIEEALNKLNKENNLNVKLHKWQDYINLIQPNIHKQLTLLEQIAIYKKDKIQTGKRRHKILKY